MTELEKMKNGLIYDPCDEEIMSLQKPAQMRLWEFNRLSPEQSGEKQEYMRNAFVECGDNCYIETPLNANWGGAHLHLGNNVYANFNLTLVDDADIFIGDNVMIGTNVTIVTANHPLNPEQRRKGLQYNKPVWIEENVWISSGVIICAGVHIGRNSVIAAGSVVTRDIPENVMAMGTPCRPYSAIDQSR